ncbi:hypothetical protein BJ165DRAFT_1530771 [Panaeolus papilionaceus]|nr:hypothetical protein BJ165DRAFT_1530771 [Panaeolus papilionaceus]
MGPTGSGKSSFIESLAPDQHLNISKNSLESVTQEVNCYQVVNLGAQLRHGDAMVILMDTPGFLDPRLSEGRIGGMITESLNAFRQHNIDSFVHIFYFQPITDIRIGGSKRDAVKILREYVNQYKAKDINIITTFWNTLPTAKQLENANNRLHTLRNEIYTKSGNLDVNIFKFDTSQASALSSLDETEYSWNGRDVKPDKTIDLHYQSLLCHNLLGRITNALQQLRLLTQDKQNATRSGSEDHHLLEVVLRDEKVASMSLQLFLDDLVSIIGQSGATSELWDSLAILASDNVDPSGVMALQYLLDTLHDRHPGRCLSQRVFQVSRAPASLLAPSSALQRQPDTLRFGSLVARFKRRFH